MHIKEKLLKIKSNTFNIKKVKKKKNRFFDRIIHQGLHEDADSTWPFSNTSSY